MNCATHDAPAIGACRACGAGLCADCRAPGIFGFVCHGECERRARQLDEILAAQALSMRTANATVRSTGAACLVGALLAAAGALWAWKAEVPVLLWTFVAAAIVFGLMGAFMMRTRFPELASDDEATPSS